MGVSPSSALWSPSLQARSSLLMSSTAASPGCDAFCIAYSLNYTAAPGPLKFPSLAGAFPSAFYAYLNRGTQHEIHRDFDCSEQLARRACNSTTSTTLYHHRPRHFGRDV